MNFTLQRPCITQSPLVNSRSPLGGFQIPCQWILDLSLGEILDFPLVDSGFPLSGFWIPTQWILVFPSVNSRPPLRRILASPLMDSRSPSVDSGFSLDGLLTPLHSLRRKQSQFYNHTASQLQQE